MALGLRPAKRYVCPLVEPAMQNPTTGHDTTERSTPGETVRAPDHGTPPPFVARAVVLVVGRAVVTVEADPDGAPFPHEVSANAMTDPATTINAAWRGIRTRRG